MQPGQIESTMGDTGSLTVIVRILTVLGGLTLAASPAVPAQPYDCDSDCVSAAIDWLTEDIRHYMPLNFQDAERFEVEDACPVERTGAPVVHGIVVAPLYPGFREYPSTQNDARLMADFLRERGVAPEFLTVSAGAGVTREKVIAALRQALRCVRERDQVVLFLSGDGTSYDRGVSPRFAELADYICVPKKTPKALQAYCKHHDNLTLASYDALQLRYSQTMEAYHTMIFFTSEVKIDPDKWRNDASMRINGVDGFELSNFVTQIRNRGADAVVLIDSSYAAGFEIERHEREALMGSEWKWNSSFDDTPPDNALDQNLVGLFGAGQFAVYYAATDDQLAGDVKLGDDAQPLGHLALAFTEALRAEPSLTVVPLAQAVAATMRNNGAQQQPIFAASSKGLKLLAAEAAEPSAMAAIEIIAPSPKRGASGIEEASFTLVARYTGREKAARAIIDGELVPVDGNGQFSRDITDAGGKYTIPIRVLSADFQTLATAELKLRDKDEETVFSATARKVALVIANQTYAGSDAFPPLRTPMADAQAVADVLRSRYGFVTELGSGKDRLDLFLKDASKAQIQQVLYGLRQRLTPDDQLIVYYAGHGESDPDLGAFWVPVDGQPKADFTWIAAEEITRELKRMNAGAILVISDSCYAGGLSRGGPEDNVPDAARKRYLAKASRLKARQLITSGGDEPVEDGGGGGHSVFAKALIAALTSMPERTFTASELFEEKVKPAVISAANATSEGQTPGFSRIARAGDEPGSEFVFQAQAGP